MDNFQLPPLREDITLHEGADAPDGSPTWSLFDPVRNQYFSVGWQEFEFLSRWHVGDAQSLVDQVNKETTLTVSLEQCFKLLQFLANGQLIKFPDDVAAERLHDFARKQGKGKFKKFMQSYLFFKLRLVHPDKFLRRTLPFVRPLLSRTFAMIVIVLALFGLFLVSRQWQSFTETFAYYFSFEGIFYYFLALFGVKVLHELGHAYVATYYGVRVTSMGVVFLIFWPVFYTDTTDAWKLTAQRERVHIAAAGIIVELIIAVMATLAWSFLPDGPIRNSMYFIATVSWFMSLLLNLNPFLRFDGYYLLADLWNISNLQIRSFELGKWQLRKWFFGWDDPVPYTFPPHTQNLLIAFAYCTWIYRFFLMIGIALILYYFFFKLLAVVAMIAAVIMFLVAPIGKELLVYWKRRDEIKWNLNSKKTAIVFGVFAFFIIVPWKASVNVPGLLEFSQFSKIYVPESAQLKDVNIENNQSVIQGQVLMRFQSPELEHKIDQLEYDIKILQYRLRTELGRTESYGIRQADEEELGSKLAELNGLREQQRLLTIKAKYSGVVMDVNPMAKPGVWFREDDFLFEVIQNTGALISAYVPEETVKRIRKDKLARFYPENYGLSKVMLAKILAVDPVSTEILDRPYLATTYGGKIAVHPEEQEGIVVKDALYRVILQPIDPHVNLQSVTRGTVQLTGYRRSILARAVQLVSGVFVRESGF